MYIAYEYVHKNSGVDDASYYPYTGRVSYMPDTQCVWFNVLWKSKILIEILQDSSCAFVREGVNVMINGSQIIEQGNEEDLQIAVATHGPVSVAVDASSASFRVSISISYSNYYARYRDWVMLM